MRGKYKASASVEDLQESPRLIPNGKGRCFLPSVARDPKAFASLASVKPFSIKSFVAESNISLTLSAQF